MAQSCVPGFDDRASKFAGTGFCLHWLSVCLSSEGPVNQHVSQPNGKFCKVFAGSVAISQNLLHPPPKRKGSEALTVGDPCPARSG